MFDAAPPFDPSPAAPGTTPLRGSWQAGPAVPAPSPSLPLQQSNLWMSATRALGGAAARADLGPMRPLVLRRHWPLIGEVALISRARLGWTTDVSSAVPAHPAADLRRDLGARHLIVNAETTEDARSLALAGFRHIAAPRIVAELDLSQTQDALAARLSPKWRNRLRHGQSQGLVIRRTPFRGDPRHWLLRAEAAQARHLWYQPLPPTMIAAMAAARPGAAQLFTAYRRGEAIAAMLFLRHGAAATYQIGWSSAEGRRLSAGPALMWRAMLELQAMGTTRLDLGAADPATAPGLAHFKRGTGAALRSLGGTWLDTRWLPRKGRSARQRMVAELNGARHGHILALAVAPWSAV